MEEEDEEDRNGEWVLPVHGALSWHLQLRAKNRRRWLSAQVAHLLQPVLHLMLLLLLLAGSEWHCDATRHLRRHHRHLRHEPHEQPAKQSHQQAHLDELHLERKVAALASKLEQVLLCHRLGALEAAAAAASGVAPACAAHYDGHLCWPGAATGESVRLACPRLQWPLPGQQQQQQQQRRLSEESTAALKSVMSAAAAVAATATASANDASTATATSITWPSGERPISQLEAEMKSAPFAHRKCLADPSGNGSREQTSGQGGRQFDRRDSSINLMLDEQPSRWQNQADYSQCSAGNLSSSSSSSNALSSTEADHFEHQHHFDPTDNWIKLDQEDDHRLLSSLADELYRIEGNIDPYADPDLLEQWALCIRNIMQQQQHQGQQLHHLYQPVAGSASSSTGGLWCPIIFDGWRCWPSTRAGETAYVSCPSNQPGFSAERKAHKICTNNGTWYKHPMTNRYWSNYTTCVDTADLAFRTKILNLYIIGNLISLVALAASLIVFISFKSLNCTRVTIHKNLFLSFITNNLMWIIWYTYVVNDASLLQSNPWGCQLWHILLHYFLVSNYFWMFCEGLYLHTLLVVAFVSEDKILKWFYILGWLTPVPLIVAYAYNRSYDEYYTNFCWMEESPYNLILMAPIGISLLLNLVFLINIVRVLVTKLRANNSPDAHQTRKAVRATLILIPLLGLHYILTPFRPEAKSEWEGIYETVAAVCTSFQGLCVAMLFCFCNGEVTLVLKKRLKLTFDLRRSSSAAAPQLRSRSNTYNQHSLTASCHLPPTQPQVMPLQRQPNGGANFSLRSVISSSSNDLLQQVASAAAAANKTAAVGADDVDVGCCFDDKAHNANTATNSNSNSNNSNTGSLITTVTASPINCSSAVASGASTHNRGLNDNDLQRLGKLDVGEENVRLLQAETMATDFSQEAASSFTTTSFSAV